MAKQRSKTVYSLTPQQEEELLFPVVERFLDGQKAGEIIDAIQAAFSLKLGRELVYKIVRSAVRKKLLHLCPPLDKGLSLRLTECFGKSEHKVHSVHVVNDRASTSKDNVPVRTAHLVLAKIRKIGQRRSAVHLGLGIGHSTLLFAQTLGALVRSDPTLPKLHLHALSPAFSTIDPLETPIGFYSYLAETYHGRTPFEGLFAEPLVSAGEDYEHMLRHRIVQRAFECKGDIDIIVSSMASSEDEHGYLRAYLDGYDTSGSLERLEERGWRGDVQLLPYGDGGAIELSEGTKAVTLFDLRELVQVARHADREVYLMSGPCSKCDVSKDEALLPLLQNPSLRIWSHLIVGLETAQTLLDKIAPASP